ncbi:MAG: SDR family NAD(P)-dependent oxidoreductase [Promethearchaeota archaeon]|jgi:short-subunit dehydrogenase
MKKKWYKGKVFVITGASGDIGSAVCRVFAPLGMRMYLLDLPNPAIDGLVEELKELGAEHVEWFSMDLTNKEQISQVLKTIGEKEKNIDILYNNAGIGSKCSITNNGSFEEYRKIMSINVDGMWLVLQAALPYIGRPAPTKKHPDRREGQLIFSSSSAGKTGVPYMAAYAMSKSAIIALANSIRLEYKIQNHKIDIITVVPAPTDTKFYHTSEMIDWINSYKKKGLLFKFVKTRDIAKRVLKASRKRKKEVFVPRWWKLLDILFAFSHHLIGNLLIKIENQ